MINPVMLVTVKNQTIVGSPFICVDDTAPPDKFHDNRPYFCPPRIPDNLGVDPAVALEEPEYGSLSCAPSPPAFASAAKVALIQFNLALKSLTDKLLVGGGLLSDKA